MSQNSRSAKKPAHPQESQRRSGSLPVVLTIAGSDNSCGAGIQADLQTITAFGAYPQTAVTCVVAEIPGQVSAVQAIRPEIVAEQIRLSLRAFPVAAIKTGMLFSTAILRAVADTLREHAPKIPLVVDPVMVASSGDPLLRPGATAAYRKLLFPLATIVTPNLDELRILSRLPCRTLDEIQTAGTALVDQYGCAFLLKGGHLKTSTATDILATRDGMEFFTAPFRKNAETHGTGCTLSAAIAAGLAHGRSLSRSVADAKSHITRAIAESHRWNSTSALNHRPAP
ncbi:MAG: bifunctional hydroxymethylpyrimidine kinase/phosphomethylpyrimidine kinase [Verrucomicrobiota bacterium]